MVAIRILLVAAIMLMVVATSYYLISGWAATGPGCPGDPAWLGYCSDVERQ